MNGTSTGSTIKRCSVAGLSAGAALLITYFLGLSLFQQLVLVVIIAGLLMWFYEQLAGRRPPN